MEKSMLEASKMKKAAGNGSFVIGANQFGGNKVYLAKSALYHNKYSS
jgi:hypothetical protein